METKARRNKVMRRTNGPWPGTGEIYLPSLAAARFRITLPSPFPSPTDEREGEKKKYSFCALSSPMLDTNLTLVPSYGAWAHREKLVADRN